MRDFFIGTFEKLVGLIVVLLGLGVALAAVAAFAGAGSAPGGPLAGIAILLGGTLYVILVGGMLYLGLGIYHNTRRAADAMERQSQM